MKASPAKLFRAHYATLRDAQTGDTMAQDYLVFVGLPVAVFALCCGLQVELPHAASAGLLTTSGVLSAFFFGVMLQLAQRSMEWEAERPKRGLETSWQARFLEQIAANAGYASIISVATATVATLALIAKSSLLKVGFSALTLALAMHLALMLAMVINRLFALIHDRLKKARVAGSDDNVKPFPSQKTGS